MRFDEAFATVSKHKNVYMALPMWSDDVKVFCQFPDEKSKMSHKYLYVESRFAACLGCQRKLNYLVMIGK